MNNLYQKQILTQIEYAINKAKVIGDLTNPSLKGRFREILIRDLLEPLLPNDIGVVNGVILTHNNKQSKEQDIVIYDKQILPPILIEEKSGFFPIESALYTIEIKSILNSYELKKSYESALDLLSFNYLSGKYDGDKQIENDKILCSASTIFAFSSDLKSDSTNELLRYESIRKSVSSNLKDTSPAIKSFCILNRGCWAYNNIKGWQFSGTDNKYREVLLFLSVIMNSYHKIRENRGEPRLGHYLI